MDGRIIAVCGRKNAGKTTLVEGLVERLTQQGYRVAVIKHDGHDFSCDIPGTDSYRFTRAGAYAAAVFSEHRMFVHKVGTGERELALAALFPEADIILLEGMKHQPYPKIEVVRAAAGCEPVSDPEGRFLIVTDLPPERFAEPVLRLDQVDRVAEVIADVVREATRTTREEL